LSSISTWFKKKTPIWASVQTFSISQFIPSWSTFVKSSDKVTIKFWKSRRTRSSFDIISLSKVLTSKVQRRPSWGAVPPRDNRTGVQTSLLTCFGATRSFILCFLFRGTIELGSKLHSWPVLEQQGVSSFVFFFQGTIELGSKLQSWPILEQQGVSSFAFFFLAIGLWFILTFVSSHLFWQNWGCSSLISGHFKR
jgi:hypothetical protein